MAKAKGYKTLVLNLERREDRMEQFKEENDSILDNYERFDYTWDGKEIKYDKLKELGFDTYANWIDPIENSHLTKGEVGCYLSHFYAWRYCVELGEPIVVLEDDAICTDRFNMKEIVTQIEKGYEFLYLGWREMKPYEAYSLNKKFTIPGYAYWTVGYVITPEAAKILTDDIAKKNIIPVDEYLPRRIKEKDIKVLAYKKNVIQQRDRSETGSDVTTGSRYDAFLDFDIHAVTVGTDEDKCEKLYRSAAYHGIEFTNLGKDKKWTGGDMTIRGGGQKINMLKKYIKDLPDRDVVFFCDAYDVFMADNLNEMIYRYLEIGHKILFGAERICWPNEDLIDKHQSVNKEHYPNLSTPYQYLNSGTFIGRVSELKRIFSSPISNDDDDQLYCQNAYLSEQYDMCIDTDNYIFQCHEEDVIKQKGMLYNPKTRCYNLCYHGNGGFNAKNKFNQLYSDFYGSPSPIVYIPTHHYTKLKDDILLIDFLTPSMCDSIIELSERHGGYKNDEGDKVPGQEIRMKELNLLEGLSCHWERIVAPILDKAFLTCTYYGVRDAFIIKYTMDGQRALPLHSDASLVTGSIKLNDDYTGGELYYPRQELKNTDIPVGQCILFPGQVTHPHQSLELKSGTKWSLTIWTKRQWQD